MDTTRSSSSSSGRSWRMAVSSLPLSGTARPPGCRPAWPKRCADGPRPAPRRTRRATVLPSAPQPSNGTASAAQTASSRRANRNIRGCSSASRSAPPQQAPQRLGTGNAVPWKSQPAKLGRGVPCEFGGIPRAVAVPAVQQRNDEHAGQGIHPAPAVLLVRVASGSVMTSVTNRRTGVVAGARGCGTLWDDGGQEGCNTSIGRRLPFQDEKQPVLWRVRLANLNGEVGAYTASC